MGSSRADGGGTGPLATAELEPVGRFAHASNATLLCRLAGSDDMVVYKPRRGEVPLHDFPDGTLWLREVAAYVVSNALGWPRVPETVRRDDGPFGPGSVQRYVPHDPDRHYFWLLEHGGEGVLRQLRRMVLFDLVVNNADRKGGHVLLADDDAVPDRGGDRIYLVDHGVCFAAEPKLRTVAWHFAGEPVPPDDRERAAWLAEQVHQGGELAARLDGLLSTGELDALSRRAQSAAETDTFPFPSGPRPYPWPLL